MVSKYPLEGIRVADFSWVGAGPITTRLLSEFGAEVIKIESRTRVDLLRVVRPYKDRKPGIERSGYFSPRNPNKKSFSLNMKLPKARDVVIRLIKESDIVINSFTIGQMEKWNLGYEDIKKLKPDIIYVDMPAQGGTGPHAHYMGFGATLNALIGVNFLSGFPDRDPLGTGTNYTDHVIVPTVLCFAILVALRHRRKTGEGQYIEFVQSQAGVSITSAVAVMDYAVNKRVQERMGYHYVSAAPHGVYNTRVYNKNGEPKWITIAVFTDEEWQALKRCMGNPRWAEDEKFSTLEGRLANQKELDEKIESWTSQQDGRKLMIDLLAAGVRAGMVNNAHEVVEDYQLQERGFWEYLEHPEAGLTLYNRSPIKMSDTPPILKSPAPLLGQHTKEVLKDIIGMSEEEIQQLEAEGVFE